MTTGPNEDAFPAHMDATNGLTKREYFAALAFQGMLASPEMPRSLDCAGFAVECADDLIAALNGQHKEPSSKPNPLDLIRQEMQIFGSTSCFQLSCSGGEPMALIAVVGAENVAALQTVNQWIEDGNLKLIKSSKRKG